jgi:hypothetical protein
MAKKKTRSDNGSQTRTHQAVRPNGDQRTASTPTYDQIAEAAYLRYLDRGGQHGHDLDDWIDAERSLKTRA